METIKEICDSCNGVGILDDIDGNKGACMTCNGKGYFEYSDDPFDTCKHLDCPDYKPCVQTSFMPYKRTKDNRRFKRFIDSFMWRKYKTIKAAWCDYAA